ncbi:MAG: hypothetical protein JXQ96_01970 [Cyclobacteriaceae bacterium]
MNQPRELKYIANIVSDIESCLDWGKASEWKNSNFIDLSNEVKRASGVRISADTLKRIFGKTKTSEQYDPQPATKDALAVFIGYESWSDFKIKNPIQKETGSTTKPDPSGRKSIAIIIPLIVAVAIALLYFMISNPKQTNYHFSVSGKYLTGKAYHTAVFEYDITQVATDSIFMDFGDDSPPQVLDKNNSAISHYYRGPGRYDVRMLIDEQAVYDTTVYLKTEGWEAHTYFQREEHTEYLPIYDFTDFTGAMSTSLDLPRNKGIDTTQMYWVQYSDYHEYNIDGDNFELSAELRNNYEIIPARCYHVKIRLTGEHGDIRLYFLKEGCSKWVRLEFGEISLNGETMDLSAFGKDFLDFRNVRVKNEGKNVSVYYNDTLLISQSYKQSLGKLLGLSYTFSGHGGAVRNSKLVDLER